MVGFDTCQNEIPTKCSAGAECKSNEDGYSISCEGYLKWISFLCVLRKWKPLAVSETQVEKTCANIG